jgi:two-component system chemotaxis sensor kinase CheA
MMGFSHLQALAHALEDLLGRLAEEPGLRLDNVDLLVNGGSLLLELVRRVGDATADAGRSGAYVQRVRAVLQDAGTRLPGSDSERRSAGSAHGRRVDDAVEPGSDFIRLEARRLDALLEMFGEALIAHSGLAEAARRLTRRDRGRPEVLALDRGVAGLEQSLLRLESALMEARLVPIGPVFARFGRLVRDLGVSERKRVRLVTRGVDTRLDKSVVDRIGEPLVHLVTNALIHGIESAAERERLGKLPEATLTLAAQPQSDRVIITVSDDGRGLDADALLRKAQAHGLAPAHPSPEEILHLAFLPGLSTAEQVGVMAGRGVGLDVVAASIRGLGGAVAVASTPGQGATFTLTLPLTVAVVGSLLVESRGERYAIPLHGVAETLRLGADDVHAIEGRGMLLWRGELISVQDAGTLLKGGSGRPGKYCVVLQSDARRRGLLVDRVIGHQEIVAKGLDPLLGSPPMVSGTAILGDGRVTCILDPVRIIERRLDG